MDPCDPLFLRPFHDAVLDLDRSRGTGAPTAATISEYRYVRLLGCLLEQVACERLTGDAVFRQPLGEHRGPHNSSG